MIYCLPTKGLDWVRDIFVLPRRLLRSAFLTFHSSLHLIHKYSHTQFLDRNHKTKLPYLDCTSSTAPNYLSIIIPADSSLHQIPHHYGRTSMTHWWSDFPPIVSPHFLQNIAGHSAIVAAIRSRLACDG